MARLQLRFIGLAMAWAIAAPIAAQQIEGSTDSMHGIHGLIFNQDCTDIFYTYRIRDGVDAGAVVDSYVDGLAEAGVAVLMVNTNARRTNYGSDVWQTFWDGYDPEGPDDQPYLASIPAGQRAMYRRLIHSMWAMDAQGIDYPARMIARSRQRDISPWISLRMNDVHNNDDLNHPFHGDFWRDPKYFRGGSMSYYARGLDYAHPEVRDMYRALVIETLDRYDIDGLELDFMREPYLFQEGAEAEGTKILTDWLRGVRELVDAASERLGHPVLLGVRVPSHPEVAEGWGLRPVQWAKEGIADLVVATPRWATLEYDMPIAEWKQLLAGTGVTLAGGLETLYRPMPGGPAGPATPERAVGAAAAVLDAGADCVYLFNYFLGLAGNPAWGGEAYNRTLQAMSSLDELVKLPRRHAVTWRDVTAPGETYRAPLPAEGKQLTFTLPTGPAPAAGAQVTLELTVAAQGPAPGVAINGAACKLDASAEAGDATLMTFTVPPGTLKGEAPNRIEVAVTGDAPVKVLGVEVCIMPGPQ